MFSCSIIITILYVNHKFVYLNLPLLMIIPLFTTILVITCFYMRSIKLLHEHRLRRTTVLQKDIKITELAKYILLKFACFHVTSCIIQVINVLINTQCRDFIFLSSQIFLMHYSPVNAVFLLRQQKEQNISKELVQKMF